MRYFDHDTHAADDDAIMALRLEFGGAAVDCYWTLIEKIYRDEAPINLFGSDGETNVVTKSVSHRLCIDVETLKKYVFHMLELELLNGTVENLFSQRAMENIAVYQEKKETARRNGKKGGRKPTPKPRANQVGFIHKTNSEPSSLQEKKRKDIGSYKKEPISISSENGDFFEAENPSKTQQQNAQCNQCGGELTRTGMPDPDYWFCDDCKAFQGRGQ